MTQPSPGLLRLEPPAPRTIAQLQQLLAAGVPAATGINYVDFAPGRAGTVVCVVDDSGLAIG